MKYSKTLKLARYGNRGAALSLAAMTENKAAADYWSSLAAQLERDRDPLAMFDFIKAEADKGSDKAQVELAVAMDYGIGTKTDHIGAFEVLVKTARRDNFEACEELGEKFRMGHGVEQSFFQADYWHALADNCRRD